MRLSILDDFKCLADKCPAHCCGEWLVEVDDRTLSAWTQLPADMTKDLAEHIYRLDNDTNQRSVLAKKENGNCYCLDNSGLCNIQRHHGEAAMPETCKTYPRKTIRVCGETIETASISCPEIARKILTNTDNSPLFKNEIQVDKKLDFIFSAKDYIYLSLYKLINEILGHNKYSLSLKLSFITKVMGEFVNECESVNYDFSHIKSTLADLTKNQKNQLFNLNNQLKNRKTYTNPSSFLHYFKTILTIYHERNINLSHVGFEESALYRHIQGEPDQEPDKTCEKIIQQFNATKESLSYDYTALFHDYARHIFIDRGFPLTPFGDNQLLALAACIVPINMTCIALAAANDNGLILDKNIIIETAWRIERKLGHTNDIYNHIIDNKILMEPTDYYQYISHLSI